MPVEVIMPKVDMDMASGKLSAWHVAEGETVSKGAPLFDIETDKAAMEVESPASGRLHHVLATEGETVNVGAPVAWIYAEGEAVGPAPSGVATNPAAPDAVAPAAGREPEPAKPAVGRSSGPERARATPIARRLARAAGLALDTVSGSGPRGRIQRADVEKLIGAAPERADVTAAPPDAERLAVAGAWTEEAGELFVSIRRGRGTPLLLLHGFAADSTGWLPLERELPPDMPLIRIDLPSHGKSPRRRIADEGALVAAVVAAFDRATSGPVHVLAHSLGGAVALGLADVRPRGVASLTLISPAGLGPEIDAATLTGIVRASRTESLAPWLKRLTATPEGVSWDFARAAMLARTDPALRAAQADLVDALFPDGVQTIDMRAALARVAAPTTILWGRSDHVIPWRHALCARDEIALHFLQDVGHIPHVERPGLVSRVLLRSIRQASAP